MPWSPSFVSPAGIARASTLRGWRRIAFRLSTGDCTMRRPSSVLRSATVRGTVMAPRQGEVGISLAYCQLFIQAIQTGRPPPGASFQVCEA